MKIKLASGKEMECDYMGHSDMRRQANIRIKDAPLGEIAAVFSNPDETAQMFFDSDYISGFTKLLAIIDDGDAIRVVMRKE